MYAILLFIGHDEKVAGVESGAEITFGTFTGLNDEGERISMDRFQELRLLGTYRDLETYEAELQRLTQESMLANRHKLQAKRDSGDSCVLEHTPNEHSPSGTITVIRDQRGSGITGLRMAKLVINVVQHDSSAHSKPPYNPHEEFSEHFV